MRLRRLLLLALLVLPTLTLAQTTHKETVIWDFVNGVKSRGVFLEPGGSGPTPDGGPGAGAPDTDYVFISTGVDTGDWQLLPNCVLAYNTNTHLLGCGTLTSSGSFGDLESGTNTSATMIVGSGATLSPSGTGQIVATSVPGEGVSSPVDDAMIPDLKLLSTGLTALKCVETDATGKLVSATNACNVGAGGSGVWGGITGTLSNQTDLQAALNAKVSTSTTVNGHALSSNVSVTATDVGLGSVNNTSDAAKNSATAQLTNKQVVPRVQLLTVTTNQVTPNADNTDVGYNYTFSAGLTVNTPTFTAALVDQQLLALEFSTTAPQTLAWGSGYSSECGLQLPGSTTGQVAGQPVYNRFLFRYSTTSTKWCLIASTKSDAVRVTTLATATTFTCPADNSDFCDMQMTGTAGTLTVAAPTGTPSNGQRLTLSFMCTNAQTLSWNAIFIDSLTYLRPTTCAADTTKWLSVDVRYSTVLSKWQVLRGAVALSLPVEIVYNDQGNTYNTGVQNFAAATSMIVPRAAGAAPTADGDIRFNTTQHVPVYGENGLLTSQPTRMLSSTNGGSTHDAAGGTSDVDHTGTTVTLPANYLVQGRILRICTMLRFTSSSTASSYILRLKLGGVVVFYTGNESPNNNKLNSSAVQCWMTVIKDAIGGAVNTYTASIEGVETLDNGGLNVQVQPVTIATNAPVDVVITTKYNQATAGNTLTTDMLTVEALN